MPKPNTKTTVAPPPPPPVPTLPPLPSAPVLANAAPVMPESFPMPDVLPTPTVDTDDNTATEGDANADAPKRAFNRHTGPALDLKEFVRVWQTSENVDQVAAKLGFSKGYLQHKATELRKGNPETGVKGVPLKSMKGGGGRVAVGYDADELLGILAECTPSQ